MQADSFMICIQTSAGAIQIFESFSTLIVRMRRIIQAAENRWINHVKQAIARAPYRANAQVCTALIRKRLVQSAEPV